MNSPALIGIAGSLVLVLGAALPDRAGTHASLSLKNWCFGTGALVMFAYSILNYLAGAPVFFVFLEGLVVVASALMLFDVPDRIDVPLMIALSACFVLWSLFLFQGWETLVFIGGLGAVAVGYVAKTGGPHREIVLFLGSALIALFSYWTKTWVFFWLNLFFAAFSAFHAWKASKRPVLKAKKA
jgi:hypothetical protein